LLILSTHKLQGDAYDRGEQDATITSVTFNDDLVTTNQSLTWSCS